MDIDFGQILPSPTDKQWSEDTSYIAGGTCYDEYNSEWLSLSDGNKGHALPGYDSGGMARSDGWWRCLVNVRRASLAADNADEKAAYAQRQGDRTKSFLDQLDSQITEDAKAEMVNRMLTPHVEGSTLVFPSTSVARVSGSTLILTE